MIFIDIICLLSFYRYESKGMQFIKSKPDYPIGLSPDDIELLRKNRAAAKQDDTNITAGPPLSKAAKKNAKRKEKRKENAASDNNVQKVVADVSKLSVSTSKEEKTSTKPSQEEIAKKIKNLKKKVKQIEELESKIASGLLKNPEKEQLEKIERKPVLLEEIEDLELDLED